MSVPMKITQVFPKYLSLTFCQKISHWWSFQESKVHGFWHELVWFWEKFWSQNSEATVKINRTSIRKPAKLQMKIRLWKREHNRLSQTKYLLPVLWGLSARIPTQERKNSCYKVKIIAKNLPPLIEGGLSQSFLKNFHTTRLNSLSYQRN